MPERTSYVQGTPNWVDLQTTDQAAAKTFYGELFGWSFNDLPMPEGDSVYSMAVKGDGLVTAISSQSPEMSAAGVPPMWNTYLAVDDVDATTALVAGAGGQVAMEPFDVMDAGRMSFIMDPSGAAVALWQAKTHIGATLVNEPGTLIWNELITDNSDAALPFYESVLGITNQSTPMGDMTYTTLMVNGEMVAGSIAPPMEGTPNYWHVYFDVEDVAASVDKVASLGGETVAGPFETPIGPMAVVRDPQGAAFSLYSPAGEAS